MTKGGGGALAVGRVTGAHGVGGALRVQLHDSKSTSLRADTSVSLRDPTGIERGCHEIEKIVPKPGSQILRVWLRGVAGREDAEALRGLEVWVERDSLGSLDEDEFYFADLVGRKVERLHPCSGEVQSLGQIVGVTTNGAQDLFEVRYGAAAGKAGSTGRTWLLLVLPQFLVEVSEDRVLVDLPEGMLPAALESS